MLENSCGIPWDWETASIPSLSLSEIKSEPIRAAGPIASPASTAPEEPIPRRSDQTA
jgi:hypothetical protein